MTGKTEVRVEKRYPWANLRILFASVAFLVATVVGDLKDALFN
jgi:hypothetical protein